MYHQGKGPIHTPQHSSQSTFLGSSLGEPQSPDHPSSLPLAAPSLAASVSRRCSLPLHRGTLGRTSIVAIATALAAALSPSSPPPPLPPPPLSLACCLGCTASLLAFELCCSPCAITASLPQLRTALLASGPPLLLLLSSPLHCHALVSSTSSRPSRHCCHCPCHMLGYCVAMPRALYERVIFSFVLQRWVNERVLQSLYTFSSLVCSVGCAVCVWRLYLINVYLVKWLQIT